MDLPMLSTSDDVHRDIVLIGDLHNGLRGANPIFEQEARRYYDDVLFPDLESRRPLAVFFLGDLFDDRRAINTRTLNFVKAAFLDRIAELNIPMFCIIGNHDIHYKNSLHPNSVSPILREYPTIRVIDEPTDIEISGRKFLLVPWVCQDNRQHVCDAIESESSATVLVGHFDIIGFDMQVGNPSRHGFDPATFSHFDLVVSGHYHVSSRHGNIWYPGTPYQMTRADNGQVKGHYRLNVDTLATEKVINPHTLFETVEITDETRSLTREQAEEYATKIVTAIVKGDVSDEIIERAIKLYEDAGVHEIKVIDPRNTGSDLDAVDIEDIQALDTLTIIFQHIDGDPDLEDFDRERLKRMASAIYGEAMGGTPADF